MLVEALYKRIESDQIILCLCCLTTLLAELGQKSGMGLRDGERPISQVSYWRRQQGTNTGSLANAVPS